jgi:hypothetical protein
VGAADERSISRRELAALVAGPNRPTEGFWRVGDIVMNSQPQEGEPVAWIRTAAGPPPSTWNGFGTIGPAVPPPPLP